MVRLRQPHGAIELEGDTDTALIMGGVITIAAPTCGNVLGTIRSCIMASIDK